MQFVIEQIALCPPNPDAAIDFLRQLGLDEWVQDHVCATGTVEGSPGSNEADLAFNYQATPMGHLELEVLHYTDGPHWMDRRPFSVSHLGMHCSSAELEVFREKMAALGVKVVQEVNTTSHTNPVIAGKRTYNYTIFGTRYILGVDLKFIVRRDVQ